jgi:hypothetical protein
MKPYSMDLRKRHACNGCRPILLTSTPSRRCGRKSSPSYEQLGRERKRHSGTRFVKRFMPSRQPTAKDSLPRAASQSPLDPRDKRSITHLKECHSDPATFNWAWEAGV